MADGENYQLDEAYLGNVQRDEPMGGLSYAKCLGEVFLYNLHEHIERIPRALSTYMSVLAMNVS